MPGEFDPASPASPADRRLPPLPSPQSPVAVVVAVLRALERPDEPAPGNGAAVLLRHSSPFAKVRTRPPAPSFPPRPRPLALVPP